MTTPPESGPTLDAASPLPPDIEAADEPTKVPLAIEDWLTVIIMGALALITFANVIVRYFTDSSFAWTEEFSVFLMIMLALVAGSAAVARDRHIRIEYFSESGSMARRKRLAQFGALTIAILFTLIGALSIRMVWTTSASRRQRRASDCPRGGIRSGCRSCRSPSHCARWAS
jgi:TRAP-type C4-dicarboxylate transport system permease small subunit